MKPILHLEAIVGLADLVRALELRDPVAVIGPAVLEAAGGDLDALKRHAREIGITDVQLAQPLPTSAVHLQERHNEPWRRKNRRHR